MNSKIFATLWLDALEVNDRDTFASDWALSSIWEDEAGNDEIIRRTELC